MKKLLFFLLISSASIAQVVNAPKIPNVTIQRLRSDAVSFSVRFQQDGTNMNISAQTFKCDFLEGGASVVRVSLSEGAGITETDSATLTVSLTAEQVALLARESYRYRLYTVSGANQTTKLQGVFSLLTAIIGGATSIVPPTIVINYSSAGSSNVGGYVGPSLSAGNALTISGGGGAYTIGVNYTPLDARYAALSHTQAIGTVTGLQSALNLKVNYVEVATVADIIPLLPVSTVTIFNVLVDNVRGGGGPMRYEIWPIGVYYWFAAIPVTNLLTP